MESFYLYAHVFHLDAATIDVVLTLGWFILLCSLCVRRPEDSGFKRKPHRPISLLPAAIH